MTAPTQAQIEALLTEYEDELTLQQRKLLAHRICALTAATIKRCAQIADDFGYGAYEEIAAKIAAAIRKAKDE